MILKTIVCQLIFTFGVKKGSSFTLSSSLLSYTYVKFWGCSISRELWRKIEMIQKQFITYNLKVKGNTTYHVLLIEDGLSPTESMSMFGYPMYKKNIHNMEPKRLPKFLLPLVKTPSCASSAGDIRMLSLGSTFGGLRRRSSRGERTISKILLPLVLRTKRGMLRSQRVKGS